MAVTLVAAPPARAAPPPQPAPVVTYSCSPAPSDCAGWYRSAVTVTWSVTPPAAAGAKHGCWPVTFTDDTPGAKATCSAGKGHDKVKGEVTIRLDRTPPEIKRAIPARPPDYAGWFTSPIRFDFIGKDKTSGLASCGSASYAGPDAAAASIMGTCADQAGNVAARPFALSFDATPPPLSGLTATPGDRRVALAWQSSPDATSVEVRRSPGRRSKPAIVVFKGPGRSFVDDRVENGVRYEYEVRVADAAGHETSQAIAAVPGRSGGEAPAAPVDPMPGPVARRRVRLLSPAANATFSLARPPLLRWIPVRRARYYNVQLFRGARKVLSAWPTRPRYQIRTRWTHLGTPRRLRPGRYRWYVWPGFGARSKGDYGRLLGRRAFTIVAR